MAKNRTVGKTEREAIEHPADACETAAYRLNVVIEMLREEHDPSSGEKKDNDGGYRLSTAINLLYEIRDELRKSVARLEAEEKAAQRTSKATGGRK